MSEAEWIQHRKLRKKIASAKWYAKKKKAEIHEENELRARLAETLLPPPDAPVWTDRTVFAHWHASLDHHLRGYPMRPTEVPVVEWVHGTRCIEDWLERRLRRVGERGCDASVHIPWDCTTFGRCWRALAVGEWMQAWRQRRDHQGWLGWTLSVVGAAFVAWQLRHRHRTDAVGQDGCPIGGGVSWAQVARAITQVATISSMVDQIQPPPPPHSSPPNQNPTRNTVRNDPLSSIGTWWELVRWMNTALFDPLAAHLQYLREQEGEDEMSNDDSLTDSQGNVSGRTEELTEDDDAWMDAYLQPYLRSVWRPLSVPSPLDHVPDEDDVTPDWYVDGELSHPGSTHSDPYEPPCLGPPECTRWICDTPNPPTTNGNDDLEALDPWSPTDV